MVLASSERMVLERRSVAWAITRFFGTSTFLGCPSRAQYIAPAPVRATAAADLHARYARLVSRFRSSHSDSRHLGCELRVRGTREIHAGIHGPETSRL